MELNQTILDRVILWGQELEGFKVSHAKNALTIVQGYVEGVEDDMHCRVEGIGTGDLEKFALFAINLAWTFWIDEIFDTAQPENPVDVDAILLGIREGKATTQASMGFCHLRSQFSQYSSLTPDYLLWLDTAASAIKAWQIEEQISHQTLALSYSEYVDLGYHSTAVPHILATASLLYDLHMPSRLEEETIQQLIRYLSISCRLHNDIFSVEKEIREGSLANAVLLMSRYMSQNQSRAFIEEDLKGYERMMARLICALPKDDPFARLAKVMPEAHKVLYTNPLGTYQQQQSTPNN